MITLINNGPTVPTAFVTRGRQRVKQYSDGSVYLNNGDEFEVELFNPITNKVLAEIELNGVSLGSGIVLRPGERVFLERYFNDARKFLFETYEVNKNDMTAMKAIANNGNVVVKFYSEHVPLSGNITWTSYASGNYTPTYTFSNDLPNMKDFGSLSDVNCFYSSSQSAEPRVMASLTNSGEEKHETGRIEKGSHSNQSFTYDNTTFNTWWSWKSEWKILPLSQKPVEMRDIKVFCTKCGAKQKRHTHKFCPICGTKYE